MLTEGGLKWFKVWPEDGSVDHGELLKSGEFPAGGAFVGTYTHSLDSKKRLTIPSEWRELAGESRFFVLPGIGVKCLYVFPAQEMIRRMEKFRSVSITDSKAQQFARTFFSRANQTPWDSQGRIRVGDDLLNYADLINQVVLVGIGNRFELWSPEKWKEQNTQTEPSGFVEAAQYIGF